MLPLFGGCATYASVDLTAEQVDELVAAGRALLRNNPEFRRLLDQLGATTAG